MLIVNLWFIKHSNGLFYYGLDYADALFGSVREIWVRDAELADAVRRRFPTARVATMRPAQFLAALFNARWRGDLLFTPSPHPVAFYRRQIVVVHDSFPFAGRNGRAKRMLLKTGLSLSRAYAGYINHADAKAFLLRCGIRAERLRYLPNRLGPASPGKPRFSPATGVWVVGLFGSDSPKKNYDELFAAAETADVAKQFAWRIYGHANAYTTRLQEAYPTLTIDVIESDGMTMSAFIGTLDIAMSAARGEGFARPIAMALMQNVPTLLLDTPVFREFYAGSAALLATPEALVAAATATRDATSRKTYRFSREKELRNAFSRAVDWLNETAR